MHRAANAGRRMPEGLEDGCTCFETLSVELVARVEFASEGVPLGLAGISLRCFHRIRGAHR